MNILFPSLTLVINYLYLGVIIKKKKNLSSLKTQNIFKITRTYTHISLTHLPQFNHNCQNMNSSGLISFHLIQSLSYN